MNKISLLFTLIFVLSISSICFGQTTVESTSTAPEKEKKFSFSINIGNGIPLGKFSKIETIMLDTVYEKYNLGSGAKIGIGGRVDASYNFGKNIGITAAYYYSSFGVGKDDYNNLFDSDKLNTSCHTVINEMGRWNVENILLGVFYQWDKNKFQFGIKAMAGQQWVKSPEADVTLNENYQLVGYDPTTTKYYLLLEAMNSKAFSFAMGGYAKYPLSEKLFLNLAADYIHSNHHFEGNHLKVSDYQNYHGPENIVEYVNFDQTVSFLNIMFGIGISF